MTRPDAVDVLIVDDHPIVLGGLRRLLETEPFGRVHEATDVVAGYRLFQRYRPGLVIADLSFENGDFSGYSLIRRIRALEPEARVLVCSMHDDPVVVARALESGALGYLTKDAPAAVFLEAFDSLREGRSYLEARLATKVAMLNLGADAPPLGRLNARELQILSLLSHGKSYRVIAEQLSVSYRTVIGTCSTMRHKLGVRTLAELVRIGMVHGSAEGHA